MPALNPSRTPLEALEDEATITMKVSDYTMLKQRYEAYNKLIEKLGKVTRMARISDSEISQDIQRTYSTLDQTAKRLFVFVENFDRWLMLTEMPKVDNEKGLFIANPLRDLAEDILKSHPNLYWVQQKKKNDELEQAE